MYNWGWTRVQSSTVPIPISYAVDGILPVGNSKLRLLIIHLASFRGTVGQFPNGTKPCSLGDIVNHPQNHRQTSRPFTLTKNNCKNICATQKLRIYLQPGSCAFKCGKMKQDLFQAIADPTRRAILALIAIQALTPNAMAEKFDMSRQAVSKHIKVLQECELIKPEQSGREIYYHFNPKKMQELDNWLAQFRKSWETQFNQLDKVLSTIKKNKK